MERKGYVICGDHRSGSTYLCQLLTSTGMLGRPKEFFSDPFVAIEMEQDPAALQRLLDTASTPNGIYGLKVFTQQFDVTMKSGWPGRLPGLRFVYLRRLDLLGQAMSFVRSIQTDRFRSTEEERAEPIYDGVAIAGHLARLADNEARWRRYFARNGLDPLWLSYEALVADPAAAVAAVAGHIGFSAAAVPDLGQVTVSVQRDEASGEWRRRFVAECGDVNYLDHRRGQWRLWLRRLARDLRYFRRARQRSR
ncbi:MAG: trehalose 2-sulfotransferase [Sphingomonadales bacterium]|jgi:LPS sulfotransferase NodH|nr:trehalose 2-sulfotransferase [Sphingomonadales bacterium]